MNAGQIVVILLGLVSSSIVAFACIRYYRRPAPKPSGAEEGESNA